MPGKWVAKLDLHHIVVSFVRDYSPRDPNARALFIDRLRTLVNAYADAALKHGGRPEVGIPHKTGGPGSGHRKDF